MAIEDIKDALITLLTPVRSTPDLVEVAVKLHATPIDIEAAQVALSHEITRLFAPVPDIEKPLVTLVHDDDGVTARMHLSDMANILARYRTIADPTREGKYAAFTDTPELNRLLVSIGMDRATLYVPYQSHDEVDAHRMTNSINKENAGQGGIDFTQGPDGPRHTMSLDTMITIDGVARFHRIGEWGEAHMARIRDLGMGLSMIRSRGFDKTGNIASVLDDGFSEGIFDPLDDAEIEPEGELDTSFADRLAAQRAKGGAGRAIGGGERYGPAHVVDMQGKTWAGRTDGSGE